MLCPPVSPGPRGVPLLSGCEPPAPAHVAVDIPEGESELVGEETTVAAAESGHISPACRVVVRAVFVAYTAFAAPALAATALTRFGGGLRALLLVALTAAALFMATVRVSEDEDREREEQEQEDEEKGLHG